MGFDICWVLNNDVMKYFNKYFTNQVCLRLSLILKFLSGIVYFIGLPDLIVGPDHCVL